MKKSNFWSAMLSRFAVRGYNLTIPFRVEMIKFMRPVKIMQALLAAGIFLAFGSKVMAVEVNSQDNHYRTRNILVGYPPYAVSAAKDAGMEPWRTTISSPRIGGFRVDTDFNQAKADQLAAQFKTQGFNIALLGNNYYLFNDTGKECGVGLLRAVPYEDFIFKIKMMTEACHRQGLRCFVHLTSTMVDQTVIDRHPDWAVIDIATGKPPVSSYGPRNACFNNDEFMAEFLRRFERLVKESGVDGVMQDEIQFFGDSLCGCNSCRKKFKQATGFEIPDRTEGWLNQLTGNPCYAAWLAWRRSCTSGNMAKIRAIVKKYNPENTVITYLCNNTVGWCYAGAGLAIDDFPKYADSVGYECEPHGFLYQYQWPHVIVEMKYLRAVAENMNTAPWVLFYDRTMADHTFNWLVAMSQGLRLWWPNQKTPSEERCWEPLLAWEKQHAGILSNIKSAANVGVLFSLDARDRNPGSHSAHSWMKGFFPTCNALTDGHIPYKVLVDADMTPEILPSKVKTLFLFNTGSMSEQAVEAVRSFVKNGGILLASGKTSLFDAKGAPRNDFGLADVLGCSWAGENQDGKTLAIREANQATGDVTGELAHRGSFIEIKDLAANVKVLGIIRTEAGKEYPGILVRDYGKGKVVYFTGHPEFHYDYQYLEENHNQIELGKPWKDFRDPQYGRLIRNLACYGNQNMPLTVKNLPQGVVAESYQYELGELKGIQVHLVNLLCGCLKEGIVPVSDIQFPDVKPNLPQPGQPITISVKSEQVKKVYLLSPDFDVTVELPFKQKDGYATVELPGFARYALLYFSEGNDQAIRNINKQPPCKTIPEPKKLIIEEIRPLIGKYDPKSVVSFVDDPQFTGGEKIGLVNDELCCVLYGAQSDATTAKITLNLREKPDNPVLQIGGMDDNQPFSKAPLEIKINNKIIFSGKNTYPNNEWAVQSFTVDPSDLKIGENIVEIKNTGLGPRGSVPWFGISFVRIKAAE